MQYSPEFTFTYCHCDISHIAPPPLKKTKQNTTKSEKTAFNGVVYMSAKREPDLRAREHYHDRRTLCNLSLLSISGTRRMTHTNALLEY